MAWLHCVGNYSNSPFSRSILTKQKHFNEKEKQSFKKPTKIYGNVTLLFIFQKILYVFMVWISFESDKWRNFYMKLNPIGCVRKTLRSFQIKQNFLICCEHLLCLQKNKFISFYWFRRTFYDFFSAPEKTHNIVSLFYSLNFGLFWLVPVYKVLKNSFEFVRSL